MADGSTFGAGMPVVQQVLVFGGKQLRDSHTLADYNIHGGASIHLVLPLRGD
jgi:ubiquitin-like protein Nedd8